MKHKEILITNFLRISKIPRESGYEEKIADFLLMLLKRIIYIILKMRIIMF